MFRVDHETTVAVLPTPAAEDNPGYFTAGDPVGGVPATIVTRDWANQVQEELMTVVERAGLSPSKSDNSQLWQAIAIQSAQKLATMAALLAATEPMDSVYLMGYYTAGDGGHALYFRTGVTTPGSAGTFVPGTGTAYDADGRAYRMLSPFNVRAFGAKGDNSTDDTTAVRGAIACAILRSNWLNWDQSTYYLTGTLTPNDLFLWNCAGTTLRFSTGGTYTQMKKPDGSNIGVYVCVDTINATGFRLAGKLTLIGGQPGSMTRTTRANVPSTLCAISASDKGGSNGAGAEAVIDSLWIQGFGYGLLQSDQNVGSYNILPYTRWQVGFLHIQFCLVPFKAGASGTGFDDFRVDNLRLTRNGGQAYVTATRMNCGTVFNYGLNSSTDKETETVSTTASSATVTFSASMTGKLASGDVICIARNSTSAGPDRNYLPSANALYWHGRVSSVSGTSVTMEEAVPNTVSGADWYFEPPWIELQGGSGFICDHFFCEGIHRSGMMVGTDSRFVCQDLKVSTGEYAGAMGAIVILNRLWGSVDVRAEDKAERTDLLKRFVVVPMLTDPSPSAGEPTKSSHVVSVKMTISLDSFYPGGGGTLNPLAAAPIELCALPDFIRFGGHNNDTAVRRKQHCRLVCNDGEFHHDGNLGYAYQMNLNNQGWGGHLNGQSGDGYIRSLGTNVTTSSVPSTVNITAWTAVSNAVWLMVGSRAADTRACALVRVNNAADGMVITDLGSTGGAFTSSGATLQYNQTAGSSGVVNIQGLRLN